MTDRVKGLYVALEEDYRTDDVECIIEAIKMIKGVTNVRESIVNPDDHFNRERVKREIRNDIMKLYRDLS